MVLRRYIDWKTIPLVLVTCYAAPWVFVQIALSLLFSEGTASPHWHIHLAGLLVGLTSLVCPGAAGYFTARFASQRPRFNAMVAVLLGIGASMVIFDDTLGSHVFQGAVSLLMGGLGAFLSRRGAGSEA